MHWKRLTLAFVGLSLGIVLVACGSGAPGGGGGDGDDGGGDTSGVSQLGFVSSSDYPVSDDTGFGGGFADFGAALPADFLSDPFLGETLGCEVFVISSLDDFPESPSPIDGPVGGLTPTLIDAGTPITVTSSTAFSATLAEVATGSYATTTNVSGSLPDDAVLNVPGAVGGFPEFTAAPFPDVAGFTVTVSPTNDFDAITVDSAYSWTASSVPALVTIEASTLLIEGETISYVGFTCLVDDADQSLALPETVKTELTDNGFVTGTLTADRTGYSVAVDGSAALVLGAESQATDPTP